MPAVPINDIPLERLNETPAARILREIAEQQSADKALADGWLTLAEARALAKLAGVQDSSARVLAGCVAGVIEGARRKGQSWVMPEQGFNAWLIEQARPVEPAPMPEPVQLEPVSRIAQVTRPAPVKWDKRAAEKQAQLWGCAVPMAVLMGALLLWLAGC